MLLKKIINNLPQNIKNINIEGLSQDSRQIKKNYLFFAVKGKKFNGEKYILNAVSKGAKAVICSQNCQIKTNKVPDRGSLLRRCLHKAANPSIP